MGDDVVRAGLGIAIVLALGGLLFLAAVVLAIVFGVRASRRRAAVPAARRGPPPRCLPDLQPVTFWGGLGAPIRLTGSFERGDRDGSGGGAVAGSAGLAPGSAAGSLPVARSAADGSAAGTGPAGCGSRPGGPGPRS